MKKKFLFAFGVYSLLLAFGASSAFAAQPEAAKSSPKSSPVIAAADSKSLQAAPKAAETGKKSSKTTKSKKSKTKKSKKQPPVVSTWSPNKFPIGRKGYCTWYADGRFAEYFGEKLEFSLRNRTNAKTWFERVSNLEKTQTPSPGDIVVFKASTKKRHDPTGHVAFVEAVDGDRIIVSQGNFDYPGHQAVAIRYIDGKKVTVDVMVPGSKPGRLRVEGCSHEFILAGYLHKTAAVEEKIASKLEPEEKPAVHERQITGPEQAAAESAAN